MVELAGAALMSLADVEPEKYGDVLKCIGLNPKKAEKVHKQALHRKPAGIIELCGTVFCATEILKSDYANEGLYCFDVSEAVKAIDTLGSNNAQGEIYLTDALEYFSNHSEVALYEVESADDMLTYSKKTS